MLLRSINQLQQIKTDPQKDHLLLTSIHRAKGLEWPLVVIPGLADGGFPLLSDERQAAFRDQEDERRLFYVAMTRAIKKVPRLEVILSNPVSLNWADRIGKNCSIVGESRYSRALSINPANLSSVSAAAPFLAGSVGSTITNG